MRVRVRILTILAGPNVQAQPGVTDLEPELARKLVEGGFAVYLDRRAPVDEAAVIVPPERAVVRSTPTRRPKGRSK